MLDVKKTLTKMLTDKLKVGKVLWEGVSSWSSGNITVPNSDDYIAFLIYTGYGLILAFNDGTSVTGFGANGTTSNNTEYLRVFYATKNNNVWTWSYAKQLSHYASGNHSAVGNTSVDKIIGLIPNWGS